jgi:hypothetical protein
MIKYYIQQSGAVEACWAHNPEVRGSKPRSARILFQYYYDRPIRDSSEAVRHEREVKTGFYRNKSMHTGSSGTLIGWKSGQTTFVPLWDRMEGAWLRTLQDLQSKACAKMFESLHEYLETTFYELSSLSFFQ